MSGLRDLRKSIAVLVLFGACSPLTLAQFETGLSPVATVSGVRCCCGRWTCPACQQQLLCEPCIPLPDSSIVDMAVQPESSLSDMAAAPPSSPPNASNLFASNRAAGSDGGFGSSLRGATTPEMMGDLFGSNASLSFIYPGTTTPTRIPTAGYALGRMKMAENSSPIPRNRVFLNYSLFTGVQLADNPVTVNRFAPGFESTFLDGLCSLELRAPLGTSINNDILADGLSSDDEFQFGNLFLALKGVLIQRENWLVSAGSSLLVPTAGDTRVFDPSSRDEFLRVENNSTHIMPFIGGLIVPNDRLFAQWMVQCDVDLNGNPVIVTQNGLPTTIGTLQDFTLLYTDLSIGYWLYKAGLSSRQYITGIAPLAELHYNRSLTAADVVSGVTQVISDFDNLNIQAGVTFNIRNNARLGLGYVTPLGNGSDRVFDNEFRVTFNRYF